MAENGTINPKLRLIDTQTITYEGEKYLLLRDPLMLTEKTLLVPQPMIPALAMCDGARNVEAIRAALALRFGLFLTTQRIEEFIAVLDDALLLENEHSLQARQEAHLAFHQAAYREPASAGLSYPEDSQELAAELQGYIDRLNGEAQPVHERVRGIVSPHIDYERGGLIYAQVWGRAAESVREADLAIIFGTDHYSEGYPISLTRQNYATPFGVLPTEVSIVDQLAAVMGEGAAFAGELHHRREHSIELAAVWMHHIRAGEPIALVPILTGSLDSSGQPMHGPDLDAILDILRRGMQGRRAIVVAAGDMAHVGPAFDGVPVTPASLISLKDSDDALIQAMCQGDAEGFNSEIQRIHDKNNVCGVSPIYMTLRLLAPSQGERQGYAVCPADTAQTSVVTICGVTLK